MSFEFEILMQTNFHKVLAHFLTQDSLLHLDFSMNRGWWFQSCLLHGFSPMDTPRLSVAETLLQVVTWITWSTWITWIKSTWLKRKWQYLHLFYIHCNVWYLMICIYHRYLVYLYNISTISGWRFGTFFIFPYIGNNNRSWLIFFKRHRGSMGGTVRWLVFLLLFWLSPSQLVLSYPAVLSHVRVSLPPVGS